MTQLLIDSPAVRVCAQAYEQDRVWLLDDGRKLRTRIHIDSSYAEQSRVRAELWDGTKWHGVLSWPGKADVVREMPSVYGRVEGALDAGCDLLSRYMLAQALKVVG